MHLHSKYGFLLHFILSPKGTCVTEGYLAIPGAVVCWKNLPSEVCRVHAVVENIDPGDLAEGEVAQSNHKAVSVSEQWGYPELVKALLQEGKRSKKCNHQLS